MTQKSVPTHLINVHTSSINVLSTTKHFAIITHSLYKNTEMIALYVKMTENTETKRENKGYTNILVHTHAHVHACTSQFFNHAPSLIN